MAEEIGYGIIGEERKDAPNVIDYNINKEQTKDLFAEINANNQTTTGMATVIPGINAPKLRAATSIVGGAGGGGFNFSEIKLETSVRATGGVENIYDTITSSDISDDLYLDGYKIYTSTGGLYMFQVGVYTSSTATIQGAGLIYVLGTATLLTSFNGPDYWTFSSGMAQVPAGAYFRMGITPSASCRPEGIIRLLKLQ